VQRTSGGNNDGGRSRNLLFSGIPHKRNGALFYKTLSGAEVGNLFISLIHTCELNGANPFHYLTELQRQGELLKHRPSAWTPWNQRDTLARLAQPAAA